MAIEKKSLKKSLTKQVNKSTQSNVDSSNTGTPGVKTYDNSYQKPKYDNSYQKPSYNNPSKSSASKIAELSGRAPASESSPVQTEEVEPKKTGEVNIDKEVEQKVTTPDNTLEEDAGRVDINQPPVDEIEEPEEGDAGNLDIDDKAKKEQQAEKDAEARKNTEEMFVDKLGDTRKPSDEDVNAKKDDLINYMFDEFILKSWNWALTKATNLTINTGIMIGHSVVDVYKTAKANGQQALAEEKKSFNNQETTKLNSDFTKFHKEYMNGKPTQEAAENGVGTLDLGNKERDIKYIASLATINDIMASKMKDASSYKDFKQEDFEKLASERNKAFKKELEDLSPKEQKKFFEDSTRKVNKDYDEVTKKLKGNKFAENGKKPKFSKDFGMELKYRNNEKRSKRTIKRSVQFKRGL